ncbi:effector-associated domain 2-containing protein [Amycolatopsis anabasis]|uniref:effector-associated domain 2-containing protein n=1 Tax=Amycolatopsis anabasis TaxID=1840409 RepID=UPI001FE8CF15|nr:trypsin-like peptidase domain-containing protein [Amycolatopsis anabasis]
MANGRTDRAGGWQARVLDRDGDVVGGAGVLVAERRVLTCAHVVAGVLGIDSRGPRPVDEVSVDFPDSGEKRVPATVEYWAPVTEDGGDVAVLELAADPAPGARPAALGTSAVAPGDLLRARGYPHGGGAAVWAESRVLGRGGPRGEWVQLDGLGPTGSPIVRGFSGAGAVDARDRVAGILVAALTDPAAKVCWMIPLDVVATYYPALRAKFDPDIGRSRDSPPASEYFRVVDALESVPCVAATESRRALIRLLRPAVSGAIREHPGRRMHVMEMLNTCLDYDGGLAELVGLITRIEGEESLPVRRLIKTISQVYPGSSW